MFRLTLYYFLLVPTIAAWMVVAWHFKSPFGLLLGTAVSITYGWVVVSQIAPRLLPWVAIYQDLENGNDIEVLIWGAKQFVPTNSKTICDTIRVVKASIDDGRTARIAVSAICTCKHLLIADSGKKPRRKFGLLLPKLRGRNGAPAPTVFFTHRGIRNKRVLYEEIAHSLEYLDGQGRRRRYSNHLTIFRGLQKSEYWGQLPWYDRAYVESMIYAETMFNNLRGQNLQDAVPTKWSRFRWVLAKWIRRFNLYK